MSKEFREFNGKSFFKSLFHIFSNNNNTIDTFKNKKYRGRSFTYCTHINIDIPKSFLSHGSFKKPFPIFNFEDILNLFLSFG
jgi:hypothetical protein